MDIKELIAHLFTALALLFSGLGSLVGVLDPVWSLVSATSGTWFPAIAVTAGTILPEIGLERTGTVILLGAAILFVSVQIDRLIDRIQTWRQNR